MFLYFLFLPTMLYRLSEEISRKSPFLSHLKSNHKGNYCNPVEVAFKIIFFQRKKEWVFSLESTQEEL